MSRTWDAFAPRLAALGFHVGRGHLCLEIPRDRRTIDTTQYSNRTDKFDFDMIVFGVGQSESPGNEQRSYWSSVAADSPSARNVAGSEGGPT